MIYIHANESNFATHLIHLIPDSHIFDGDISQLIALIQSDETVRAVVIPHFADVSPHTLASTLGWSALTHVMDILVVEDNAIRARRWGRGGLQTVCADYPVVMGVLPEIIKDPLPLNLAMPSVHPISPPQNKPDCTLLRGNSPQIIATHLIDALTHEGIFDIPAGIDIQAFEPATPPLTSAPILVAAGKGIAYHDVPPPPNILNPFAWKIQYAITHILQPLTHALGGRLAASRAVIDAATVDSGYQVGQSGRRVMPDLYLAVGISGMVQHLQGMQNSRVIVAINPDPDAPIFEVAHYGVVGDAALIVPALTDEIRRRGLAVNS